LLAKLKRSGGKSQFLRRQMPRVRTRSGTTRLPPGASLSAYAMVAACHGAVSLLSFFTALKLAVSVASITDSLLKSGESGALGTLGVVSLSAFFALGASDFVPLAGGAACAASVPAPAVERAASAATASPHRTTELRTARMSIPAETGRETRIIATPHR
jgi:hypothetical protein